MENIPFKKGIAGAGVIGTLVMGGIDASVLNEDAISRVETVAEYAVEAKQVGDVVETTFPWKDQPGIKVKYDLGRPTLIERTNDKRKKEIITETVNFGDGGFKVDILLNEKPDTNEFCYTIEGAENYDFFYQSPLSAEEKLTISRPENINGSYAVYHKDLKNNVVGKDNYATGKVMHIPRPQVWSMSDTENKVWADMNYDNGNLCITVPQSFLDAASYPVRVDPTFGYTSVGGSSFNVADFFNGDGRFGTSFTGVDGTLDSIHVYFDGSATNVKAIVNTKDSGGSGIHNQVVSPIEKAVSAGGTWETFTASGETLVSSNNYILNAIGDSTGLPFFGKISVAVDNTTGSGYGDNAGVAAYATPESPWTPSSANPSTFTVSIYATYSDPDTGVFSPWQINDF